MEIKSLHWFGRDRRKNDGLKTSCKKCCNIESRKRKNTKAGRLKTYKQSARNRNIE